MKAIHDSFVGVTMYGCRDNLLSKLSNVHSPVLGLGQAIGSRTKDEISSRLSIKGRRDAEMTERDCRDARNATLGYRSP